MTAFLNPHLLWGLLLVSAPIIIHLLNRRRFEVHPWAAMEFLLQADVRNRRRIRLEDLLLLLLRAGLIAAAVLLVARPLVQGLAPAGTVERLIVLDDSFSMEYRSAGASSLERARDAALFEVQEAIASGARVSVRRGTRPSEEVGAVSGAVRPGAVFPPLTPPEGTAAVFPPLTPPEGTAAVFPPLTPPEGTGVKPPAAAPRAGAPAGSAPEGGPEGAAAAGSRLLAAIRALTASDGSLRIAEALEGEAERIEASSSQDPVTITVLTDLRRGDWLEGGSLRPRIQEALERLGKTGGDRVSFRVVDCGEKGRENAAIERVAAAVDHPVAGVPVAISVLVRNFGSEERRGISGEVAIGDPANPTHRIPLPSFAPIPPGGSAAVEVEHIFPAAGEYPVEVRVDEDRLSRDDRAFAVVLVRSALSVLLVDGDPGADRFAGEAGFLAAALSPRGGMATGIAPEIATKVPEVDALGGRDLVLLLNVPEISAGDRAALDAFARRGGGIGFFLGSRVTPEGYAAAAAAALFPASLKGILEAPQGVRIDFGDLSHPALAVYRGIRDSTVERIAAARYFDIAAGPGGRTVATYADAARTPAIIEAALGSGRVAIFNITADRDWTDWPTDPSFPVLVQEWARHLAPRGGEARSIRAGDALSWPPEGSEVPAVIDPRGARLPAALQEGAARFDRTDIAGFYRIQGPAPVPARSGAEGGPPGSGERWFAVNRALEESDLSAVTEGELRAALADAPVRVAVGSGAAPDEGHEGDIWRWLAFAAACLLLGELGCAAWVGRR
jgi:hypothetical protein